MFEEQQRYRESKYKADSVFIKQKKENPDVRKFETYQNQRVWMGMFKDILFPHERPNWSDKDGKLKLPRDSILLPVDGDWRWQTEWIVEIDNNFHDKKGWSYANDYNGPFKRSRGLFDLVRRRKWVRYAVYQGATVPGDRRGTVQIDTEGRRNSANVLTQSNTDARMYQSELIGGTSELRQSDLRMSDLRQSDTRRSRSPLFNPNAESKKYQ